MNWWFPVVFSSAFYSVLWAVCARFLDGPKQLWLSQIIAIPFVLILDVWYVKGVALASQYNIPYVIVVLLNTSVGIVLSLILGYFFFKENLSWMQILGIIVTMGGITLLSIK